MLSVVYTTTLYGLDANIVAVETDTTPGLPAINIVGLPSATIKEAKERIRSAIINSKEEFPMKRVTINLSPAASRKNGSHFDLPMAIGILLSNKSIKQNSTDSIGFIGELSLNGDIIAVDGVLPLVMGLKEGGIKKVVVPFENGEEACLVKGIEVIAAKTLPEVIRYLNGVEKERFFKRKEVVQERNSFNFDFSDVKGQSTGKRAITIAAAGGHSLYMLGSPGVGKSMLAKRIPTILPPLSYEEVLEVTKIYSVAGKLSGKRELVSERPFRMPHHSITQTALMGGGHNPKPGEISLAHKGVLFLDELPEFDKNIVDMLRQPIEDRQIVVNRAENSAVFPCDFILIAAGNPCKCGYYGDEYVECRCSPSEVRRYRNKLSGPFIDRMDIQIKVENSFCERKEGIDTEGCSEKMYEKVMIARERQQFRYKKEAISLNKELEGQLLHKYCHINENGKKLLHSGYGKLYISMRSKDKILKVARTIADMEEIDTIKEIHIAEALGLRSIERYINDEYH